MKIYLVRHGESASDIQQKYDGDYDDHLTDKGKLEASNVAEKLANKKINHIFSSSRIRAVETSDIIKEKLHCAVTIIDALKEQDIYNAFKSLAIEQPEEEYRLLGEVLINQTNVVEGTETYEDFKERVIQSFQDIMDSEYEAVAIITHGGPIRCVYREFIKTGELKKIGNGAIIELEISEGQIQLRSLDGAILNNT